MENKIRQQFFHHLLHNKHVFGDYDHVENFYELDQQIVRALKNNQLTLAQQLLESLTLDLLKLPKSDEYRGVLLYYRGLTYHISRLVPVTNPDVQTSLTYTSALLTLIDELQSPLDFMYAIPVITESLATMLSFLASPISTNESVRTTIRLIEEGLVDPNLSLSTIAATVGLSNHYLSSLVKQETGESIPERIRRRRIDASTTDLSETALPICTIAETYCFPSCTAYINTFKSFKQMTPLQYRQLFHIQKR